MGWILYRPLGTTSIRPFVCERRRNWGPHSIWQIQVNFSNVLFWTPTRLFCRINLTPIHIKYMSWSFAPPLGGGVHVCERRRNLGPHSIWLIQVIFFNVLSWNPPRVLVGSIWNLYILNVYGLKLYTFPLGRCRSVRLSVRGVETAQHFINPSNFFQCSILNLSWSFGRINLKPIQIGYIWVGVVHFPLAAALHRAFFLWEGSELSPPPPHSILMI